MTVETRTFRAGGRQTADLAATALEIRARFRRGGLWVGAYLGLVVMVALVQRSRRASRAGHGPDAGACLACGRCFGACPQKHAPLVRVQGAAVHA